MKKLAIASALLSALAITGTANAYQAEVGAAAAYVDPDNGSSGSAFGVDGTYYFNPVQTRNAPLAEAAFLDRASNVNAQATFADRGDLDNNTYGVGAEVFVPNSDFYLSGNISKNEAERFNILGQKYDFDTTYYSAEVGYLPAPGLLIAAGVKGYDNDNDDGVDPTVRAKYVTTLSNGKDINLEAGAAFGDLDEYNLAADYFIDKSLSVGADYHNNDLTDQNEFGINARKFFTEQVSLEGRVGFGEVGNNDYNSFGVAAKYRF
ncbi:MULTISPECIES: putative porin [unclassified Acinetobacter]|uniref:putative porin n=1 Tax=unclassified Acinetobacter TaxID=196816 RepID=UPI000A3494F1|nr:MULTISPECIES: putative porin [unclassified Acinetobacter]MDN5513022.1 putative porin [Acinetobacter sp.]MDN5524144.1 putative porin [Acinetobacter sp.]OTG63339.1 putative porin [Acinetobacter sp. ANC 3903]